MFDVARTVYAQALAEIRDAGLYKDERVIETPQGAVDPHRRARGAELLRQQLPRPLVAPDGARGGAARRSTRTASASRSVRFICGTQDLHKELERTIARFFGTEDTILYSSCFDANGGLFETLLGEEDAIISDALNHASIIDGIRLCKAERHRYPNGDMAALEEALAQDRRASACA